MKFFDSLVLPCLIGMALGISGCGGNRSTEVGASASASAGQVAASNTSAQVGHYAASRFAEQASFGPTPALVAEIRQKGYEKWIDEQFALPATLINPAPYLGFVFPTPIAESSAYQAEFPTIAIAAPDQLRSRVTWALSQFIVVSDRSGDLVGAIHWINLLQQRALGSYADLLYNMALSPAMAFFLDNAQNRPKSDECPHCAPNENFSREIMQLFSLGVFKLNADGSPLRNPKDGFVETYSQRDVEELARVFTGWTWNNDPPNRPQRNFANWAKPMVPTTWPPERDSGAKTVLGRNFAAGQSQDKDLRDAISMLMEHPNIAPFVATRMIQHLVKSNPTPQYVGRVAAKFRNNGHGMAGDMKAVVKAILLDSEARVGDNPATSRIDDGKFREPFLHTTAVWRGIGCNRFPTNEWGPFLPASQRPFSPISVFSFYAPTDRAPGSNLLAPEQKLVNASEFTERFSLVNRVRWDNLAQQNNWKALTNAGCGIDALVTAYNTSPRAFNDLLSEKFFRGAMPPTLRSNIEQLIQQTEWPKDPAERTILMFDYALTSPYFGVIK